MSKCFTAFELEIHDRIPVIEKGIGINGKVASISDGSNFPKPDMAFISETGHIHPYAPAHAQVIMYADYAQRRDPQTGVRSTPIIITGDRDVSGRALVLWIVKENGPNYFSDIWSMKNTDLLNGPVTCLGYVQYLFSMANENSHVLVKPKNFALTLQYSRGTLTIYEQ
jgi:hypothetical protein